MYRTYNARPIPGQRPAPVSHKKLWLLLLIPLIIIIYVAYALLRPIPEPKTTLVPPVMPAQVQVSIPWPASGHAAFGADGYGLLDTNGEQTPRPTASVAKVITAMTVLQKKPLKPGEQGPAITLTANDRALYNQYIAKDGAVVPIIEGQTITQYQALQALLLPSANNIADTLITWSHGSMPAYTAHANAFVKTLDMTRTTVSDASGFSPATTSTPGDLVRLGDAALDNPVIAEIINQKEAVFPNVGPIYNVNNFLGQSGIRGIKTGTTDEAGGCYLAAADITVGGKKVTVITAIMGAPTRPQAMRDSIPLIQSAVSQFRNVSVIKAGQQVGKVTTPWGDATTVTADKSMTVLAWNGTSLSASAKKKTVNAPAAANTSAGTFSTTFNGQVLQTDLHTSEAINAPSVLWRLTHPF